MRTGDPKEDYTLNPWIKMIKDSNNWSKTSSILQLNALPSAKQRATKKLSLSQHPSTIRRQFNLNQINLDVKAKVNLQQQIENYLYRDDNTVVTPDLKKTKKGTRCQLTSQQELFEIFMVDEAAECSYSQFTRYRPETIIKLKLEDWGTCLCMTCLNWTTLTSTLTLTCEKSRKPEQANENWKVRKCWFISNLTRKVIIIHHYLCHSKYWSSLWWWWCTYLLDNEWRLVSQRQSNLSIAIQNVQTHQFF